MVLIYSELKTNYLGKDPELQKNNNGFTLIELIIVIVIVGILTVVSIPIYRGYTLKSKMTEGRSLAASVITSQRVYYSEFGEWYDVSTATDENKALSIDSRSNTYFKKARTWHSTKYYANVISAEAISESEDLVVYQFWPYDMTLPATYPRWLVTDTAGNIISEEW